jgi:transposase
LAMSAYDPGCVKTQCFMWFSSSDSGAAVGDRMKRFVEGTDRGQSTLFPECLEDWIDENNPVRVIDVFVDELDLGELGFDGVAPEVTGRPSYHPSILLKLYIYGYLNRVQSSRRLEREAGRNIEVMWLTGRLVPDHKTIADFRKDNGGAIRKGCARFIMLCRRLDLFAGLRQRCALGRSCPRLSRARRASQMTPQTPSGCQVSIIRWSARSLAMVRP